MEMITLTGFLCEVIIFHYLPGVIMYTLSQRNRQTWTPQSLQQSAVRKKFSELLQLWNKSLFLCLQTRLSDSSRGSFQAPSVLVCFWSWDSFSLVHESCVWQISHWGLVPGETLGKTVAQNTASVPNKFTVKVPQGNQAPRLLTR